MPRFTGVIRETNQQCSRRVDVVGGKYVLITTTGVAQFAIDKGELKDTMRGSGP